MSQDLPNPSHPPLLTAADFTAAYRQLFILLNARPLDMPRLSAVWAAMDAYVLRCPCPTWPLAIVAADGTPRPITSPEMMLLQMSLDVLPQN